MSIASGHKPFPSAAVSNITSHSTVRFVKLAKRASREGENSKNPHLAKGSPAPAGGSKLQLQAPNGGSEWTVSYQASHQPQQLVPYQQELCT